MDRQPFADLAGAIVVNADHQAVHVRAAVYEA